MSTNKTDKRRKVGEPVDHRPEPVMRLLRPQSECATTALIAELSGEVTAVLRARKRRREARADDDLPEAE